MWSGLKVLIEPAYTAKLGRKHLLGYEKLLCYQLKIVLFEIGAQFSKRLVRAHTSNFRKSKKMRGAAKKRKNEAAAREVESEDTSFRKLMHL